MWKRVLMLLKYYLLTVAVFIGGKGLFVLHCGHLSWGDFAQVIGHGLTLDLSTALYLVAVPMVVVVVSLWWKRWTVLRRVLTGYNLLIALALALAILSDASLYPYWGFKLDASVLQYLKEPSGLTQSLTAGQLLGSIAGVALLWIVLTSAYQSVVPKLMPKARPVIGTLLALCAIPPMIVGMRGGTGESTTNVGQAYFSQNQFLNHAAVNPLFSFIASLEKSANTLPDYQFFPDSVKLAPADFYPPTDSCRTQLLTTTRPNIIIILMESAGENISQAMPALQQIKREGISFDRCYGNTWRTDRGTVCALSGYPSFPRMSVMKMPRISASLPSIARTLGKQGWQTSYIYGGDINFTNQRSYLVATGWQSIVSMDDFSAEEQSSAKWGVRDDIVFSRLLQMTKKERQPFLIGCTTLSSHEPWDVPVNLEKDEQLNAFRYLDQCLSRFIDSLKLSPLWDNTLVVILPDHAINRPDCDEQHPDRNRIPMVWTGGAVKEPRRFSTICNQTDLAATLLAQLGLPHSEFRFSRNVLSESYTYPFAVHNYTGGFSVIDSTGFMAYDLDAKRITVALSPDAQRLERMGKAILQITGSDLRRRAGK